MKKLSKKLQISKGDIYYADLNPIRGSEQRGIRPVLIIQNDIGNKYSPTVIVAPITTKKYNNIPTHVRIKRIKNMRPNSIVLLEQVRTIDKSRLKKYITKLNDYQIIKVEKALTISFGFKG